AAGRAGAAPARRARAGRGATDARAWEAQASCRSAGTGTSECRGRPRARAARPRGAPRRRWSPRARARAGRTATAPSAVAGATGASIAANKVGTVRAALCLDAATAAGARRWNDANVLALSLRATSEAELREILDAWFASEASDEEDDRANVEHLREIERGG